MTRPKVVIIGAGFGGLNAARALDPIADVTLIDRHNFQTFLPLLYQVATAGLAADHVAHPVRSTLRKTSVKFYMSSPVEIDNAQRVLTLESNERISFDYLVLAVGSATNDFKIPGVAEFSKGMKSVSEALTIRSLIMRRFEDLCQSDDDQKLSISVVGGGPTGVEMAGAIAELAQGPLTSDAAAAAQKIQVNLIEAGPRLLPSFSDKLSERTRVDLTKLGVRVLVSAAVAEVTDNHIRLMSGEVLESQITIWAAGVRSPEIVEKLNMPMHSGRVEIEPTLQVVGLPHCFAIGDVAGAKDSEGKLLPMVAPVAIQQAKFLVDQIRRASSAQPLANFVYRDKGSMATIGRHKAVVESGKLRLSGPIAWYAWLWLHLFYLLGGRNKIGTMADWTWNYFTFDRSNRHIMDIS